LRVGGKMAKFLWEQRNPWNFNLYTPEEVTKILTARLKRDLFRTKKANFLQRELLSTAVCLMREKYRLEKATLSKGKALPKEHAAVIRQLMTVISKINPAPKNKHGNPTKGEEITNLEEIING